MSTYEELLQDFEGSDSETLDDGDFDDGLHGLSGGDMIMEEYKDDDDDEPAADGDAMEGVDDVAGDDADDAKAKIEKMQLGQVRDVRKVAGLMEKLTPILEP